MLFGLVIILNKNNQSVSTSTSIPAEFFKGAVRQAIESFNVNPQRIRSTEFNLLEDSDKMAAASYLCTPGKIYWLYFRYWTISCGTLRLNVV